MEVKEVFLPQMTAYASLGLPANFTVEAMYIADWEKSPLPACGTFFSPSDALSDGCAYALASGEFYPNPDGSPRSLTGTGDPLFVPRGASEDARDQGQWGAALRYYADWLNDGTDIGTYFVNFHDKLPIGTFSSNSDQTTLSLAAAAAGGDPNSPICLVPLGPLTDEAGRPTRTCACVEGNDARASGKYLLARHPEDIHMIGTSFNTTIADFMNGTAVSGELAYFTDMPFQIDTTELTGADFENAGFPAPLGQPSIYRGPNVTPGEVIPGYQRTEALHGQMYTLSTFNAVEPAREPYRRGYCDLRRQCRLPVSSGRVGQSLPHPPLGRDARQSAWRRSWATRASPPAPVPSSRNMPRPSHGVTGCSAFCNIIPYSEHPIR